MAACLAPVRFASLLWLALWPWFVAEAQTPKDYLYVANSLGGDISIIDIPGHRVVGSIPHSVVGNQPDDIISNRDGSLLFVSRINDNDVIAISTATEQVAWRVDVGGSPNHLSLSADERYLYAPLYDKGALAVVDTRTRTVVAHPDVGSGAHGSLLGPSGKYVYVGCMGSDQLTLVEAGGQHEVSRIIALPDGVRPFQISAGEKLAYLQLTKLHGFVVLDLDNGSIVKTVNLPILKPLPTPTYQHSHYVMNHGLGISPDQKLLVANATMSAFTAIYSLPELTLLGTVPVGEQPNWVVFSKDSRYAYVSNPGDNTISVISLADRSEAARIKVGDYPQRMTVATTIRPSASAPGTR